jgi:hypothetical protein
MVIIMGTLRTAPRRYFRERFTPGRASRFGGFLSLNALAIPCSISNSPLHDGHFRCEETITVCIGRVDDIRLADRAGERMVKEIEFDGAHGRKC